MPAQKITKAVIPAAGFGTRFLPQTKAMPKEMLPLVDKPIIQHIVEQLVKAGITDIIIVTGYHKRSIEDHFDSPNQALLDALLKGGKNKKHYLEEVERISKLANFYYLRQKGPKGNMTPLMNAKPLIGNESVIYTWADDFFDTGVNKNEFEQLILTYKKHNSSILGCYKTNKKEDYDKYGFASGKYLGNGELAVKNIQEKPGLHNTPSNLAVVSCYLYTPELLQYFNEGLKLQKKYDDTEFIYTHVVEAAIKKGVKVIAKQIKGGEYMDTGNKLSYLKTVVKFGLKDKQIGDLFKNYIKSLGL